MENNNIATQEASGSSIKDYIKIIRNNLFPVILITSISLVVAIIYAITATNIYESTTTLKISKPMGGVLESPLMSATGLNGFTDDRFISTEMEILKSYSIRSNVARALIDTFYTKKKSGDFYLIFDHTLFKDNHDGKLLDVDAIAELLSDKSSKVSIDQKKGVDLVDITVSSPSPYEASLIANCYASEYLKENLLINRGQLTSVKEFLDEQSNQKQKDLNSSEEALSKYQSENGIISLDAQSQSLITQMASLEAQRDGVKIDFVTSNKILSQLKDELKQQDPKIAEYLQSQASQSYYQALQDEVAKIEVNKDVAVASRREKGENSPLIKDYDSKINELKEKLSSKLNLIKSGIFSSSPDIIKDLTEKILDAEIKAHASTLQLNELNGIINNYEKDFNKLPKTSIEYARLERTREADEKLFSLLEEKHQEAQINELSQPGNVIVIDNGRVSPLPSKPNRILIIILGFVLGAGMSLGFVFIKNYFNNTIKTPEDVQSRNINVLAWIPFIEGMKINGNKDHEFIVAKKPDSIPSEAFKALRTRVQYSKVGQDPLKTILVTSSTPGEGKTLISANLAGTFAQLGKKTLIIDTDLRKPRAHTLFGVTKHPGLVDYLFNEAKLEEIIRPTELNNLSLITSGTIPPNPSEILASKKMRDFIEVLKKEYEIIVFDSAPVIAVTDSEILSSMVDATILVVSADITEFEVMEKSVEMLKQSSASFVGTVLNNFSYKGGYGSYYKYYYYYAGSDNNNGHKKPHSRQPDLSKQKN
ncbi:MAG: polysaccharide biosynthesis tyrosine autokinase [Ignavibacteriaceae bacterium]|nr:polysaccharide biosynthesis tyrosine autokinase [Ignavibacteriaceae bacterium]